MSTLVYTRRLFLGSLPTNWASIYKADYPTVIIRDIEIQNTGTAVGTFFITIQAASGSPGAAIFVASDIAAGELERADIRVGLEQGDEIWATTNGGSGGAVITGYTFES